MYHTLYKPCLTILGVKQSKFLASSRQQMGIVVRNTPFVVQSRQKTVLLGSGRTKLLSMRKKKVQLWHSGCLTGWIGVVSVSTATSCEALDETQRSACSDHGGLHRRLRQPNQASETL